MPLTSYQNRSVGKGLHYYGSNNAGSGFIPPLSGLYVWLDSSDPNSITLNGSAVATWTDKTGNGMNAVQATGANQPTYTAWTQANKAGVTFSGSSQWMKIASATLSTFTIFFVFKATANGLLYEQSPDTNSNPGSYFYTTTGDTVQVKRGSTVTAKSYTTNWGLGGTWRVAIHSFGGTNATNTVTVNGVNVTLSTTTGNDPGTGFVTNDIYIGTRGGTGLFLTGTIAEILIYTPVLNSTQLATVNSYLNNKWGVY